MKDAVVRGKRARRGFDECLCYTASHKVMSQSFPVGRRSVLGVGAWILAGLVGCAPAMRRPPSGQWVQFRKDPSVLLTRVATLRGLPERRPTPVHFHDPATFAALLESKAAADGVKATPIDIGPVQLALGLLPETADKPGSLGRVQRDEVVAFYDQQERAIHVKEKPNASEEVPLIIAHEIGHSLQDQYFKVPDIAATRDEDQRL